jgi:hypothetical protein
MQTELCRLCVYWQRNERAKDERSEEERAKEERAKERA